MDAALFFLCKMDPWLDLLMIQAKVVADSISPSGVRLITIEGTYHRYIHGEVMTHRVFSRNAASSRAIPVKRMLKQVWSDPAMPVWWGKNQAGMQAPEELTGWRKMLARKLWVLAGWSAVCFAWALMKLGVHKQIANRVLEPWMWMKIIITATEWGNFFNLRRHPDAQPEINQFADRVYEAIIRSTPEKLDYGQWHLPYLSEIERTLLAVFGTPMDEPLYFQKLSAARCARVSYMNHDGTEPDNKKDLELYEKLVKAPHASPFEHQATPSIKDHGNFRGWKQFRQLIPNENQPQYSGL